MSQTRNKYTRLPYYGAMIELILMLSGYSKMNNKKSPYNGMWRKSDINKVKTITRIICGSEKGTEELLYAVNCASSLSIFGKELVNIIRLLKAGKHNQETILNEIRLEKI